MRIFGIAALMAALICGVPAPGSAETGAVGIVKSVKGEAFVVRNGQTIAAEANMEISIGDRFKTGPEGSMGLILEDDTVVALGPETDFHVNTFEFNPAGRQLSFIARVIRGTISYLSGQIATLMPEQVRLETPDATIGMRGTRVLIHVKDP
jgi:hypothetical protein